VRLFTGVHTKLGIEIETGTSASEGRSFSRAEEVADSCNFERTSAREESAFPSLLCALLLLVITVLSVYLRIHLLTAKSFWLDEGFSVMIARLGWSDFWQLLWLREANMALYYLLLHFWMDLGKSEFFVRSLSVIFSTATIPAIYLLGSRLFRPAVGFVAALLLAVNAFDVRYAQEARSYSLLVLLATVATLLFVDAVEHPSDRRWTLYTVFSALCVYSQFFGILVPFSHGLSLLALRREQIPRKEIFRSARYLVYALVPIAIFLVKMGPGDMWWLPRVNFAIARHFFVSLAGNGGTPLLIFASVAALVGFAAAARLLTRGCSFETWRYAVIVIWFGFPVAAVTTAGLFRPFFLARYLILSLPAWLLLVAVGVCRLAMWPAHLREGEHANLVWPTLWRSGGWALLLMIALLSVRGVRSYYRSDFDLVREDWRAASHYLLSHARRGDVAFFYVGPGRLPFEYYRSLAGAPMSKPEVIYPASAGHLTYHDFLVTPMAEVLPNIPERGDRVWLVLSSAPDMINDVMRAWYGKRYPLSREVDVGGIRLVLYMKSRE
jgi:mannosyltransferase